MDGAGHALDGLDVPLKDKSFFTIFFETNDRMRQVLAHHRVHPQAATCDIRTVEQDCLPLHLSVHPISTSLFSPCWIPRAIPA